MVFVFVFLFPLFFINAFLSHPAATFSLRSFFEGALFRITKWDVSGTHTKSWKGTHGPGDLVT
jgi:hypothetical protein